MVEIRGSDLFRSHGRYDAQDKHPSGRCITVASYAVIGARLLGCCSCHLLLRWCTLLVGTAVFGWACRSGLGQSRRVAHHGPRADANWRQKWPGKTRPALRRPPHRVPAPPPRRPLLAHRASRARIPLLHSAVCLFMPIVPAQPHRFLQHVWRLTTPSLFSV